MKPKIDKYFQQKLQWENRKNRIGKQIYNTRQML